MRTYLSSIFSSDTLNAKSSDPRWKSAVFAVCVAVAIAVFAELGARVLLAGSGRAWEYWSPVAAAKFEFVRDSIEARRPIDVLLVGDSTAATDLDPSVFQNQLGATAWNAAYPGNFPLAFEATTLPYLRDTRLRADVIVASFIPAGFNAGNGVTPSEAGIMASTAIQRRESGFVTGDYIYLARLKTGWPFLLDRVRRKPVSRMVANAVARRGFQPSYGHLTADVIAGEPLDAPGPSLTPRRLAVIEELADAARSARARLVLVIPPSLTRSPARIRTSSEYAGYVKSASARLNVEVLDYGRSLQLDNGMFADLNHLNASGAAVLSKLVAQQIAAVGLKSMGQPACDCSKDVSCSCTPVTWLRTEHESDGARVAATRTSAD